MFVGIGLIVAGCCTALVGMLAGIIIMMQSLGAVAESNAAPAPVELSGGISAGVMVYFVGMMAGGLLAAAGFVVLIVWAIVQTRRRDDVTVAAEVVVESAGQPG